MKTQRTNGRNGQAPRRRNGNNGSREGPERIAYLWPRLFLNELAQANLTKAARNMERILDKAAHGVEARFLLLVLQGRFNGEEAGAGKDSRPAFRKDGEKWTVRFDNRAVHMGDRVGMEYIAYLLRRPGQEISIASLYDAVRGVPSSEQGNRYARMSEEELKKERLSISNGATRDALADPRTLRECQRRLLELKEEIEEAEGWHDFGRASVLREELEKYGAFLSSCTDHRGRPRRSSDRSEKIRKSVSKAISRAASAIAKQHESLGRHLQNSIRTGDYASYQPGSSIPRQL